MITGTSQVRQGLDPAAFDAASNHRWFSYNIALSSAVPSFQEVWLTEHVLPSSSPEVVLWGVSPLVDLTRPDNSSPLSAYGQARATKSGLLAEIDRRLSARSKLAEYRPTLREPANLLRIRERTPAVLASRVDSRGFEAVFGQTVRREDAEFASTALAAGYSGAEEAALVRVIEALDDQDITVIIVEMPVPDRLIELVPPSDKGSDFDYESGVDQLDALAQVNGALFLRLDGRFRDASNFTDYTHLNREAATEFSEWVGIEVDQLLN